LQLKDLSSNDVSQKLISGDIVLDLGVATFKVQSKLVDVQKVFCELYSDYSLLESGTPSDFQVSVSLPNTLRRWYKPQINFSLDDFSPFLPLPRSQAYPLLEWGMNWCMAAHRHNFLLIHGAILEKNGDAIIFPAPPGSGKSTLCAFLANTGWRLLSDEMTVIDLKTGLAHPFVRPICLKNNSISLVKKWFPQVVVSNIARDTAKGDVAHVKPPTQSVLDIKTPARIKAVVLPHYTADKDLEVYALTKCEAYQALSSNAFNEGILGVHGFNALTRLVEQVDTVEIYHNDLSIVSEFLSQGQFKA
jgi:HprK-related kinase A